MGAFNRWYHVVAGTYGSWLPGDPRGFRTLKEKETVPFDYRNPPPEGKYEGLRRAVVASMSREPVRLDRSQREVVVKSVVETLANRKVEVLCLALDGHHLHLLARFVRGNPRDEVGIAKRTSWNALREKGHAFPGGVWARSCGAHPIKDRKHQVATFRYILKHRSRGATVWTFDSRSLKSW